MFSHRFASWLERTSGIGIVISTFWERNVSKSVIHNLAGGLSWRAQQRHGSKGASPGLVVDVLIICVAIEAIPWASDMLAAVMPHGSVGRARFSCSSALSGLMRKIRGRGVVESGEGEGSKALARASRRRPEWHEYQLTTVIVAGREVGRREGGTGGGCRRQRDDELRRSEDHDKLTKSGCLSGSMSIW